MEAKSWKYIENAFEASTRGSRAKMNKIVLDHDAKLTAAAGQAGADPDLATLLTEWTPRKTAWTSAYSTWQNTRANYGGGTQAFENLLNLLSVKPGPEQDSKIENWDSRIRAVAPRGSALYKTLLPQGRAPFSTGSRDQIVTEVKNLGLRLAQQTTKPELVTLGTEVTAFHGQLNTARLGQQGLEGDTDMDATEIEAARKTVANALYGNLGMLIHIYQDTPEMIAGFFDLDTLRQSGNGTTPPAAPPASP